MFIQLVHVDILGGQDGTTCQKGWRAASRIQAAVYGVDEGVRGVSWNHHLREKRTMSLTTVGFLPSPIRKR